ncbi:hypothetical protein DAERI_040211 [Deinococcus aerius]|uniref:DUF1795 domain-containing protein n=2 Tax=Deinococcus aerius TaxID=200253 RepID=A0A2I9DKN3_9DEIO|nr:hypothetical protein DAERI_040211 [Deinococcus aerius]
MHVRYGAPMKLSLPVALAAALLLGGAGAQTLVPFKNLKLPFTVSLPKDWLIMDLGDGLAGVTVVSSKTPPASMIRLLYAPKNGKNTELKQEFRNFEAGVQQSGAKLKLYRGRNVSYGGVRGVEREYGLSHPKGNLRLRVWFGNGAKNLYSFQITDTPERYKTSNALFSRVLASVRF